MQVKKFQRVKLHDGKLEAQMIAKTLRKKDRIYAQHPSYEQEESYGGFWCMI